jgi:ADP-ribose pyrophosphatase YjhB (NUDIX family)
MLNWFTTSRSSKSWFKSSNCAISYGKYHGHEYTDIGGTVGQPECSVESKFLKVQQHHVQMPGQTNVIPDWIWIDYHDRINVLVEAPSDDKERKFSIFEHTKYALEGRQSLAIGGGIVEPGEQPEDSARREVIEELSMDCQQFHMLGRYRTDVNRGMGWTNTFVASTRQRTESKTTGAKRSEEEAGKADTE